MTAKRDFPPQDSRARHALAVIVGWLYAFFVEEGPQCRLPPQEIGAQGRCLGAGTERSLLQPVTHVLAHRLQLELQRLPTAAATEQLPLSEEYLGRGQARRTVFLASASKIDQLLEVALQVGPADLPAAQADAIVDTPAVADEDAFDFAPQEG